MASLAQTNSAAATTNAVAEGLRGLKGSMLIPTGWEWLWWLLGLMLIGAVMAGLGIYLLTRRKRVAVPPLIPPHMRARGRLQDALALIGSPKPFVIAVSDALRVYLEERFSFRAPERTTEEFLQELQRTDRLLPDQKRGLGEFLQHCDLVKFAKYEPAEAELLNLHGAALQLIAETEPRPEPMARPANAAVPTPPRL
jgi:hypothetical protein